MGKASQGKRVEGSFFSLGAVVKGIVFSFVAYVVLAVVLTVLVYFQVNLETKLVPLTYGAGLVALVLGAFASGRHADRAGWLHGLFTGVLFVLISYYLGVVFWPAQVSMAFFVKRLALAVALGLGGGAFGANF